MPEPLSLVVSAGRLRDGRVVDLGIAAGRFVMLSEPRTLQAATVIDADARLVTESFVNAHLHLDKVYTLGAGRRGCARRVHRRLDGQLR